MRAMWVAMTLLSACTEQETRLSELPPDGVELLGCGDHPSTAAGDSSELRLTVANYNDADFVVEDIQFDGPFSAPETPAPIDLPGQFRVDLLVAFTPRTAGFKQGEMVVYLNGPPTTLRCALAGEAR